MRTGLRPPSNDDDDLPPSPAGVKPPPGSGLDGGVALRDDTELELA